MKTIIHALDIEASAQVVHDAFTTLEGLAGWWTTKVEGDPTEGGVIDFTFRGDFHPDMRVDRVDDSTVEWTCVGGHEPWADNTFSFELEGSSPVRVLMRQGYARELDDRTYGTYNFNWGFYLESLRLYLESGTGKPYAVD